MSGALKEKNRTALVLVLLMNFALFGVLLATNALAFPAAPELARQWTSMLPAGLAVFVAGVLNEQLSPTMKARLVFWRWEEPLPGREAFTRLGFDDARVDMGRLEAQNGGALPTDPREQNQTWYRLYRSVKDDPGVRDAHKAFLLYRDCTAIAAMLMIPLTAVALWKVDPDSGAWGLGGVLLAEYLIFRRAAAGAGRRFVTTVLAIKSAEG